MFFFTELFRLCTDLTVYREIATQKLKASFGFFTFFYLIFSLGIGFYINFKFVPDLLKTIESTAKSAIQSIPEQAIFSIDSGTLSATQVTIPLTVPNIATFETTSMKITSPDSEDLIINYQDAELSGSITGAEIHQNINRVITLIHQLKPYTVLIIALPVFIGLWIGRLINAAVYAAIFSLGNRIFGHQYTFSNFFGLTLHTITVAELINAVVILTYGQTYPIILPLAFLGVTTLAYLNLPVATRHPGKDIAS